MGIESRNPSNAARNAVGEVNLTAVIPNLAAVSILGGESSIMIVRSGASLNRSNRRRKISGSGFATPSCDDTTVPANQRMNGKRSRRNG